MSGKAFVVAYDQASKITFMSCDPKDLIVSEISMKDIWNFGQAPVEKAHGVPLIFWSKALPFTVVNYLKKKIIGPSVLLGLSKDQTSDHCTLTR